MKLWKKILYVCLLLVYFIWGGIATYNYVIVSKTYSMKITDLIENSGRSTFRAIVGVLDDGRVAEVPVNSLTYYKIGGETIVNLREHDIDRSGPKLILSVLYMASTFSIVLTGLICLIYFNRERLKKILF